MVIINRTNTILFYDHFWSLSDLYFIFSNVNYVLMDIYVAFMFNNSLPYLQLFD